MGCALNSMHVVYFSLFFSYLLVLFCCISGSFGSSWSWSLSFVNQISEEKNRCLLPITAKIAIFKEMLHGKTWQRRDSSQLHVMDLLAEWCVVHIPDVGDSYLFAALNTPPWWCCTLTRVLRPSPLNPQYSPRFWPTRQKALWPRKRLCLHGWTENPAGLRSGSWHPAITERSATVVCSATACKAQRLWDTSACSATAALITAETLTVCHVSMLGPHFHSRYLQYPKTSDIFPAWEEKSVCVYLCTESIRGSWVGWVSTSLTPKWDSLFDTYCRS